MRELLIRFAWHATRPDTLLLVVTAFALALVFGVLLSAWWL